MHSPERIRLEPSVRCVCAGLGLLAGCLIIFGSRSARSQVDPSEDVPLEAVEDPPPHARDARGRPEEPVEGFEVLDAPPGYAPDRPPLPPMPPDSTVSPPADIPLLPDVGLPASPVVAPPALPAPAPPSGRRVLRRSLPLEPELRVTEADLEKHLTVRAKALRTGDLSRAQLALALLEETRRALAVRNVITASALLVHEARSALGDGRSARAVRLAEAAGRLSPDLPAAHWMRVLAYHRHEASSVGRVVAGVRDFVFAWVRGFRNQVHLSVQLALLSLVSVLAAGGLFAAIQFVKYGAFVAHDIASLGPRFVGTGEILILLVALVVLPVVVLASLPLSIAFALPMLMAYQTRAERTVSAALILVLAVAPWMLRLVAPLAALDGSPVDTLAVAVGEVSVRDVEDRLQEEADRRRDFVSAVVLAHRLRRRGDLAGAETAYRQALNVRPTDPDAQNNIGVVQYLRGRRDAARMAFRVAERGGQVEPLLNLAVLSAEDGRFDEAKRLLERANAIDAAVVERYQARDSSLTAGQKLAEARLDDSVLWATLFAGAGGDRTAVARELGRPALGLPAGVGFTVVLVVFLIGGLTTARLHLPVSSGCTKCGLPARSDARGQLCDPCRSVFLSAIAVDPKLRRRKERRVRRYQSWRRWSLRALAVVAGAADVFAGRSVAGAAMLLVFCFAVAAAVTPNGWGVHAWDVFVGDSLGRVRLLLGLGIAALLSLWSVGRTLAR